jgi:plasmid stability protein
MRFFCLTRHLQNTRITPLRFRALGVANMPSLTLKNIPDSLYDQLKLAAQAHHRSLNSEILYCVERTLSPHKIDVSEQLTIARNLRTKTTLHPISDIDIDSAKNDGRP